MNNYLKRRYIKVYKGMPNYANGAIYKIWSLSTDEIYIGSTTEPLSKRMTKHRCDYKRYKAGKKNYITSFKILEYGDAKIELIEKVECKCREELIAKEGHYIRTLTCVNKYIPGRTEKEYREENKERIVQRQKQWNQDNKEKLTQYKKEWYQDNKDEIVQQKKQYREANKAKIRTLKNKKIKCNCGASVSNSNMARHKKSKKHLLFVNTRN